MPHFQVEEAFIEQFLPFSNTQISTLKTSHFEFTDLSKTLILILMFLASAT